MVCFYRSEEKADKKPIKADKKPIKIDRQEKIIEYVKEHGSITNKEARELFDFKPGDEILVLGDISRGIAILPKAKQQNTIKQVFCEIEE